MNVGWIKNRRQIYYVSAQQLAFIRHCSHSPLLIQIKGILKMENARTRSGMHIKLLTIKQYLKWIIHIVADA